MESETLTADDRRAAWPVMSIEERLDAIDTLATRDAKRSTWPCRVPLHRR